MIVLLGNPSPAEWVQDDPKTGAGHMEPLKRGRDEEVTLIDIPPSMDLMTAMFTITSGQGGTWARHSTDKPSWVASDSPGIASMLAEHYGVKQIELAEAQKRHNAGVTYTPKAAKKGGAS